MSYTDYEFELVKPTGVMQALTDQGSDELYIEVLNDIFRDST